MPAPLDPSALQLRLDQIQAQLASVGELRPGSLNRRFLRCHKPGCQCSDPDHPGHGPYWSLTFKSGGKTVTRSIPPQALERTRQQVAEYQRFRSLTAEFVEVSEQLCQARLTQSASATADQAKKKGITDLSTDRRIKGDIFSHFLLIYSVYFGILRE